MPNHRPYGPDNPNPTAFRKSNKPLPKEANKKALTVQQWTYAKLRALGNSKFASYKRAYMPTEKAIGAATMGRISAIENSEKIQKQIQLFKDEISQVQGITVASAIGNYQDLYELAMDAAMSGQVSAIREARSCLDQMCKISGLHVDRMLVQHEDLNEKEMLAEISMIMRENPDIIRQMLRDDPAMIRPLVESQPDLADELRKMLPQRVESRSTPKPQPAPPPADPPSGE